MLNKNNGFTLIEVVVSIFVIALVIVGVFTLIQSVVVDRSFAASQLQATYLAQEGIELVRNERDVNWLAGNNWDDTKTNLMGIDWEETGLLNKFKRDIDVDDEGNDIKVTVTISWQERGKDSDVKSMTKLYNWL